MLFGQGACFSAGAEIKDLAQLDKEGLRNFHHLREKTFALLENFPALTVGLVDEVVPSGRLFERAGELIEAISKNAMDAIRGSKAAVNTCGRDPYLQFIEDTALPMANSFTSIECKERLAAFLKK